VADIGVCPEYIASVCLELVSDIFATIGPIPRESAQAFVHALYPVSFGWGSVVTLYVALLS